MDVTAPYICIDTFIFSWKNSMGVRKYLLQHKKALCVNLSGAPLLVGTCY